MKNLNPSDLSVLLFHAEHSKRVYNALAKSGLNKIGGCHGFKEKNRFMLVIFPRSERKGDSFLIRNDFTSAYHKFMNQVEKAKILQAQAIYLREDLWTKKKRS